jgi:hypothetical protein
MMTMNSVLEQANEYIDQGWSILPVKPSEKRPYMTNWLQYQHVKATKEMAENWFTSLMGAGVGMVTGRISGVVVLDIESYCKIPIEELLRRYPTQMVSRTGSGGYHLFYLYPNDVPKIANRVGIFEGADIRADGGFIVLPPTRHPNGRLYEWVKTGFPGVFPKALLDIQSQPKAQGDGWITEALRGVSEGGRNDTCARLAGYFFRKGLNADIVEALLTEWNERNDPPLPMREMRTTIKSIERSCAIVGGQFTSVEFEDDTKTASKAPENSTFDLLKMRDYVKGYGSEGASWLVQDWLPDKSITFLVSPPESYKTWILLDLAVSISTGLPFLGQAQVNKTGAAMIIQQEDSHGGLTERLALIAEQKMGVTANLGKDVWQIPCIPDLPIYIHPSRMLRFDNEKVLKELEEQIKLIEPKVILIDPLYSTTSGVDNYMADLANQMMILKTWRDKYGCSFVISHHSKKNLDPDSTAREDSWGSQFLNAFLEAGWQVRRNQKLAPNEVVVRRHSKVMGNQAPISLTFDISTTYPMKYQVTARQYETSNTPAPAPAQAYILEAFGEREFSQKDVVNATGKSPSTVSRQIKQLEATGAIEKMPNGKWRRKDDV